MRKAKVAAQLKSSRMLLALNHVYGGEDKQIQCRSTMDRVAEGSSAFAKFSSRSFSLLLVQDDEVGNSCLPLLS